MAMEGNGERWCSAVDKVVVVVRLHVCEREEWGSKNPKTERVTRFCVFHLKRWCGAMTGGCWCRWMAWRWREGCTFANTRAVGRACAKNLKLSIHSSVSGMPCETAVCGDNGRWWVPVDGMEALGGLCV